MELRPQVKGLSFEPDKVHDFDEWVADVKLEVIGDPSENQIAFDWFGQTKEVSDTAEFVENTLKILALTQCTSYKNRLCWGAKVRVRNEVLAEGPLTSEKVNEAFLCDGEQLVIGVVNSKKTNPDWLAKGKITITSYLYRMAKNENAFLDESGCKWDGNTVGIGCTASVDASESIPDILMSSPGATLLSKYIRVFVVTNLGAGSSETAWFRVLCQMSESAEMLSSALSAFTQVWDVSHEQLLNDADHVWAWLEGSFQDGDLELAQQVANALFAVPFKDRDGTTSLCAKRRPLTSTHGFHHLSEPEGWMYVPRHFWLSFRTLSLDVEQSDKTYHYDVLYRYLIEEELILDGAEEDDILVLRDYLSDLEEDGELDPCPKPFAEHLAGECLARQTLDEDTRVAQIRLEARASSTIELTAVTTFPVRINRQRARLAIVKGSELVLRGRSAAQLTRNFLTALEGASFMGFGVNWTASASEKNNLEGSMVANLVMQGEFGPEAGLWLLSHILYGELKVSNESENGLIRSLAKDSMGLKINVAIDAGVAASIHAATDGERVYLCLSRSKVYRLKRSGGILRARLCDIDVCEMKGCSLAPRRAVS